MQIAIYEVSSTHMQTFEQPQILRVKTNLIILASDAISILKHLLGICDKSSKAYEIQSS